MSLRLSQIELRNEKRNGRYIGTPPLSAIIRFGSIMGKRGFLALILIVLGVGLIASPLALRAIPPRYAARYLPQVLQDFVAPETESPILPTVAKPADVSFLLAQDEAPVTPTSIAPPATFTPVPVAGEVTAVPDTPTPFPTPTPTNTPIPIPIASRLEGFKHQFQDWNNCGPATMAMTMSYFGMNLTQFDTAAVLKPDPEDRNVSPYEMANYVEDQTPYSAITRANGSIETVKRLINAGVPVILEIGIEPPGEYRWMGWYGHYLLVVAYDDANEQFWVYDSWLGTSLVPGENADENGRNLPYAEVEIFWPHFNNNYIAVFDPEKEAEVTNIIGAEVDDAVMWANNLTINQQNAAKDPENAFFWFNLGTALNAQERYEEAAAAFDQARAIGLPWRMLWYQFGPYEAYYQVGRYEDVILLADVTLKDRPYFEESFYYKGLAQAALGATNDARKNLENAASFNPNYTQAIAALTQLDEGE